MNKLNLILPFLLSLMTAGWLNAQAADEADSVEAVFAAEWQTQKVLDVEAALAKAQADLGLIPGWAAEEIAQKADARYAPQDALAAEFRKVRHRMVALLNVWQRSLGKGAEQYMHFGATTVDIYDTVMVLQLRDASSLLIADLLELEDILIELARAHKDTVMIGRTLGQHALPITFGKKVSTWLGENRRNIERLQAVQEKLDRSAILKGAVGSYLGLGDKGIELERAFASHLGMAEPYPDDWHGARDLFAEYAMTLSIISRSYGRIGNELFLLQMTDIGETEEVRAKTAVGSSTMPHKKNPSKSEALIHYSRVIPRTAEILLDDMVNVFERDNTSRSNRVLEEISTDTANMLDTARLLLDNLKVNKQAMAANIEKTNGLILAQRVTFALAEEIGKTNANDRMHKLAVKAQEQGVSLRAALEQDAELSGYFTGEQLDALFDPSTYVGLAAEQVEAVIAYCLARRAQNAR